MWDLSSPTRDRTHTPCIGRQTLGGIEHHRLETVGKRGLNTFQPLPIWAVIQDNVGVATLPGILIDCDEYDGLHLKVWNQRVLREQVWLSSQRCKVNQLKCICKGVVFVLI